MTLMLLYLYNLLLLIFIISLHVMHVTEAFMTPSTSSPVTQVFARTTFVHNVQIENLSNDDTISSCSRFCTKLYAQKRVARRDLKKKPNRRGRRTGTSISPSSENQQTPFSQSNKNNFVSNLLPKQQQKQQQQPIVESEIRPLVRSKKIEAGEDYWIDETELQKNIQRQIAIKNRKLQEGEIPKEKLRVEVVAPYKQNWIGFLSVGVIVLATIIRNFPELIDSPVIQIPDL